MPVLHMRAQDPVEQAFAMMSTEEQATEKSVNFTTFVTAQAHATKLIKSSGLKPGATMVPAVKGATMISQDPSLAHLM